MLSKGHAYVRYYALHLKDIQKNNYLMKVIKRLLLILIYGDTSAKEDRAASFTNERKYFLSIPILIQKLENPVRNINKWSN